MIHRGLRRFIEKDDPSGLPAAALDKVSKVVSFLQAMEATEELLDVASWRVHRLTGDRKGVWSLTITRNWRITFLIDEAEIEIVDLNHEDYH